MYDPTVAYRSAQVTTSSPVGQIALLYEGAIRFGTVHLAALERHDLEGAHNASIRCQAIVAALQEVLDLSAGPIAHKLDALYDFILQRLIAGNLAKKPGPTVEAIALLRDLNEAWRTISSTRPVSAGAMASIVTARTGSLASGAT
jgi:flagellar secretion chaperone FliS